MDCVCRELRCAEWNDRDIHTIYFGGGTPSQLSVPLLERIKETIYSLYNVSDDVEVTVEGNPDDLTHDYLIALRRTGFNRISMGVQSFDDNRLRFLHRRHSSLQAIEAVENAKLAGFENISVDLMFGFPGQALGDWKKDVQKAIGLDVPHISAYSLMYEDGTVLGNMLEKGEVCEISDELSLQMYRYLIDALEEAGYEHYEISNWAKPGFRSRHNSSYWQSAPYLGVGAAAHSYDGTSRWSNPESLVKYIDGWSHEDGLKNRIIESLSEDEMYDEYVMTGLRTCDGVNLNNLAQRFGENRREYCLRNAQKHIRSGRLGLNGDILVLTREGLFVSNDVMSDLMCV